MQSCSPQSPAAHLSVGDILRREQQLLKKIQAVQAALSGRPEWISPNKLGVPGSIVPAAVNHWVPLLWSPCLAQGAHGGEVGGGRREARTFLSNNEKH